MEEETPGSKLQELLESPKSRRHFLTGAAVIAASTGLAPVAASASTLGRSAAKGMPESTTEILDIAATAEAAAVTALYHVHLAVNHNKLNTAGIAIPVKTLIQIVRGILRQEQDHYAFLTGAGGKPSLTSFSFPPDIFTSAKKALQFLETADTIFTAAYMAATREFAQGGLSKLAQYSYQIGATEAEHRVLARAGLGKQPNNRSFERDLFPNRVKGAVTVLSHLGILKPGLAYPGAMAVDNILAHSFDHDKTAHIIQRHP
ncbi:MAG: ferritin-like domain-containing protein [Chloroflexota bacterium]